MPSKTKVQDPADKLDYHIDWLASENGLAEDEVIETSTWSVFDTKWVASDALVPDGDLHSKTDTTVTGWTAVGETAVRGRKYYFTNHIVTDQGRELSWSITIQIKEQ